jgi:hypothetical protein
MRMYRAIANLKGMSIDVYSAYIYKNSSVIMNVFTYGNSHDQKDYPYLKYYFPVILALNVTDTIYI